MIVPHESQVMTEEYYIVRRQNAWYDKCLLKKIGYYKCDSCFLKHMFISIQKGWNEKHKLLRIIIVGW